MKPSEIEVIKQFFFRGMLDGYVNPNSIKFRDLRVVFPTVHFWMPDSECTFYCKNVEGKKLQLVDLWFSRGDSDFNGGMTVIWVNDEPIWMMNYGGWYRKDAIPVLKMALKTAYEQKLFHGGRGPHEFRVGDYTYSNDPDHSGFEEFCGHEDAYKDSQIVPAAYWLGHHDYHGFLLAPVE